jgi:hypothetical protein
MRRCSCAALRRRVVGSHRQAAATSFDALRSLSYSDERAGTTGPGLPCGANRGCTYRQGVDEVSNFATHTILIVPLFAPDRSPIGCLQARLYDAVPSHPPRSPRSPACPQRTRPRLRVRRYTSPLRRRRAYMYRAAAALPPAGTAVRTAVAPLSLSSVLAASGGPAAAATPHAERFVVPTASISLCLRPVRCLAGRQQASAYLRRRRRDAARGRAVSAVAPLTAALVPDSTRWCPNPVSAP